MPNGSPLSSQHSAYNIFGFPDELICFLLSFAGNSEFACNQLQAITNF